MHSFSTDWRSPPKRSSAARWGPRNGAGLTAAARMTTIWAAGIAVLLTRGVVAVRPGPFIDSLTVDAGARAAARSLSALGRGSPFVGSLGFPARRHFHRRHAHRGHAKRHAGVAGIFLVAWWLLAPFGNTGLWAAFYVHYLARTGSLLYYYPGLVRSVRAARAGVGAKAEAASAPTVGPVEPPRRRSRSRGRVWRYFRVAPV